MKKVLFLLLVSCLLSVPAVFAGTYTLDGKTIHLQGDTGFGDTHWLESQVKIKFNHLKIGWDHQGKVDRIRYDISCKDGQAVLQNVKYVDNALNGDYEIRWQQSELNMNRDFSFHKDDRDFRRDNNVKYSSQLDIKPANVKSGKVEFHFHASNHHYIVIWEPLSGKLSTTWKRLS
ncbi:MAG: hypothetical protein PWR01_2468 [Clostridiales bacterium]|jgi:hypothetical protein|nr:hypothetical protein [Clostridiales bacterium]MDN5281395.1 hypothetical protein [Candidatus Ozemobacter sp.]